MMVVTTQAKAPAQPERPVREPRIWLRRRGGLIVLTDSGERVVIPLLPREMRSLGVRLGRLASEIDGEQPSRIGEGWVDE
jgi:hypothetical protein